jgi:4-amino-4-deoxy-L-arabinose transferase-like glycosyltransferase
MSPLSEKSSFHRKATLLMGVVSFFSFIYFYEGGGWNQNSRFNLLRAIVERHTLQIDAYHENTQDKAHFHGHYYSDKAPGLVLLALPFALAARPVLRIAGIEPGSPRGEVALSYTVTASAVALPAALAGVCLFFLGLRFGGDSSGAAFGTLVMCVGTPMWAYASLFWAHALVGACLVFAFASALQLSKTGNARGDFLWGLATGLAAGWGTVTEYPAAPASAMLAVLALWQAWPRGNSSRWRVVAGVALGAGICALILLGYLHAASPITIPTHFRSCRSRGTWG